MLKRKILAAAVGLVCASQLMAGESLTAKTNRLEREVKQLKKTIYSQHKGWTDFVFTSPYVGLRPAYDGSYTVTNLPSINEDMRLLQQKQMVHAVHKKHGLKISKAPHIALSGKIEGITFVRNPYVGKHDNGVNLSTAELDVAVHAHEWVTGFMAFNYDDAPDFINRNYADNSRVFLNKGFITVGNLSKSPVYGSIGQMFIPFGSYSSGMVSSPLTAWIGKTRARALNLGYRNPNGMYAQLYAFNDFMKTHQLNRGLNLGMEGAFKSGPKFDIAAGVMSDIADSNGMQSNGNVVFLDSSVPSSFGGFGKHSATGVNKLMHAVPAANAHGRLSAGNWTFLAEYVGSVRHFDANDLIVNTHGAKPTAHHVEAVYGFKMFKKNPSHLALAYEGSHDALPLNVPSKRWTSTLSTSLWRNTVEAVEFRHDKMYSRGTTAQGHTVTVPATGARGMATSDPYGAAGHVSNMLTFMIGLYF